MARLPSAKPKPEGEARPAAARAKPKPQSEGRRFFLEFLSVTLGVLLALALEQAATSWRERQRVADTRTSMDVEIADYGEVFNLRMRVDKCIRKKLDALEAHLRAGAGAGAAGPVEDIGRPPFFFSSRGAWNSEASDQLARHFGAGTFRVYSEIYQGMAEFAALSGEEQRAWVPLQTLEGDAEAIGPERRARLRESIAAARNAHLLLAAIAEQMIAKAREVGVERNRSLEGHEVKDTPLCRPLAPARP